MARLFAMIGNRPDLGVRILHAEGEALRVRAKGGPLGWGIGFYQGGEVLLRRRPIDDREEVDIASIVGDVRADMIVGHVRNATVGDLRTENTHPFRYRQWVFAVTGTLPKYEAIRERLVGSIPEFLRGNLRGDTDSEVLFFIFLSFLHDAGKLDSAGPETVREALRSSLAVADGLSSEVGGPSAGVNVVVSNGEYVVALRRGEPMRYRVFQGKADADTLIGDDLQLRRRTPELSQMHFCLLASDFDDPPSGKTSNLSHWRAVDVPAFVTLERASAPRVDPW